jgi:hypothetical protein
MARAATFRHIGCNPWARSAQVAQARPIPSSEFNVKLVSRILASLALLASSLAAQATELSVSVSGQFLLPPMVTEPGTFSLHFDLSEPLTGVVPQGDTAFTLQNVPVQAVFNGSPVMANAREAGWFSYADQNYFGFDIRLSDLLVPGDLMQLIIVTPDSLYSGASNAPILERLSLAGLSGAICYYGNGSGACTAEGPISNTLYRVAVVPEPTTLLMLPAGLALLAAAARRKREERLLPSQK